MISIVLDLEMFDEIKVILDSGRLYDSLNHYTHFSGYLLEQDQVAFSTYRESDFETKNDEMYVDHLMILRYRDSDLEAQASTVTYDGIYVNTKNGLDISTGKFKAPVTGYYAIHFNAVNIDESSSESHNLVLRSDNKYLYQDYSVTSSKVNKVINIQTSIKL